MRTFLLSITILASLITLNSNGNIKELTSNLYFSENPITFDPPLIKKNNTVFLPIRSLVRYFDGEMSQSRKDYTYTIKINKYVFSVKENSLNYNLNSIKKEFNQKPFKYKTRLYLPLNTVLNDLNYTIAKKNNKFYAMAKSQATPPQESKTTITFNYNKLNDIELINELYLPISKKTLPIKTRIVRGQLYADISPFLEFLGYSVTVIENKALLKKNATIYSFTNMSKKVVISDNNQLVEKKLNHTPQIIKNKFFVQIQPFLNDLGFEFLKKNNQLIILKNSIQLV